MCSEVTASLGQLDCLSTDVLINMADQIRVIVAQRRWTVGEKCYWRDRTGMVHQGTVKVLLATGFLGVAKKGELQWGSAVDPVTAYKTLEAASRKSVA